MLSFTTFKIVNKTLCFLLLFSLNKNYINIINGL
jgi:hypothetical protein